jgi:hypothetical protein
MRTAICGLTLLLLLAGPAAAELYGYSVSASSTDPYENQVAPTAGLFDLYIWLSCSVEEPLPTVGGMSLTGTLLDRYLGVEGIGPTSAVQDGPVDVGWFAPSPIGAPTPVLLLHFFDPSGVGGTLCLAGSTPSGDPLPSACYPIGGGLLHCEPAAVHGFSSDGSTECILGSCLGPVSLDQDDWGRVKSLYR